MSKIFMNSSKMPYRRKRKSPALKTILIIHIVVILACASIFHCQFYLF